MDFDVLKSVLELVTLMDDGGKLLETLKLELGNSEEGVQELHVHDWMKLAVLLHDNP